MPFAAHSKRMSHQPNLFSSNAPHGSAEPAPKPAPQLLVEQHRTPVWLRRVDLFLRVVVRLYLGLLVVALPWTHLWDENHLFSLIPQIAWFTANGVVRGIVSGLGLLNIWIAVSDAIEYREP
ncbi:hypothetical protein H7849_20570 [Alloacidobacterium dinghuense]|uniref:Uncharacterized protein n=1 Tax=Alloacidobacterium dinghuense TaxID=2763107 RepID=A0A7G8BFX5_9BACT|nr:hypothetical protein [Alloacidobacterium dinghuense]QNI31445.1 hypothetical protein H7849_20570 [Alloacidobacterium dinghuense]